MRENHFESEIAQRAKSRSAISEVELSEVKRGEVELSEVKRSEVELSEAIAIRSRVVRA